LYTVHLLSVKKALHLALSSLISFFYFSKNLKSSF
jgi:hypothetical protein